MYRVFGDRRHITTVKLFIKYLPREGKHKWIKNRYSCYIMKEAHKERNKLFKHKEPLKSTIKSIPSNITAI